MSGVFERFADRLSYVHGDCADPGTSQRVAEAVAQARAPVFTHKLRRVRA